MKKRLEVVEKDVQEIRKNVSSLEIKVGQLFQFLKKKFDADFCHEIGQLQNTPIISIPQSSLKTQFLKNEGNVSSQVNYKETQTHSQNVEKVPHFQYSNPNSNISIAPSSHSLYDLADDMDDQNALTIVENETSPNVNLNTPKKKFANSSNATNAGPSIARSDNVSAAGQVPLHQSLINQSASESPTISAESMNNPGESHPHPKQECDRAKRPKKQPKSQSTSTPVSSISTKKKSPQVVQCELCGKLINGSSTAMKRHLQTHTNIRQHECATCGKTFQRKYHLKTHTMIHLGDKKHQCGFCGKLFLLKKDIVAHERVHTGEKPYACDVNNCTRRFTLKSHLVMHLRTHTGEKPYTCAICEKSFSQANSLRVHKKTHMRPIAIPQTETNVTSEAEEDSAAAVPTFSLIPIHSSNSGSLLDIPATDMIMTFFTTHV